MCCRHSYLHESGVEHTTAFLSRGLAADVTRVTNNAYCCSLVYKPYGQIILRNKRKGVSISRNPLFCMARLIRHVRALD